MSKYLFYRITHDSGFAPNPFGQHLTLAACTPNHTRGCSLNVEDYIIGVESDSLANQRKKVKFHQNIDKCLIYIGIISDIKTLDKYYNCKDFEYKKVKYGQGWEKRKGDNVYFQEDKKWKWLRGHEHDWRKKEQKDEQFFDINRLDEIYKNKGKNGYQALAQDIKGNRVYICKEFLYFGDKCVEFDTNEFAGLLPNHRSYKINHDEELLNKFKQEIVKLKDKYGYGKHGNPILYRINKIATMNQKWIWKTNIVAGAKFLTF